MLNHLHAESATLPFVAPVFADHMVLQRDQADPLWGWTKAGETITVTMSGRTAQAVAFLVGVARLGAPGRGALRAEKR